MNGVASTLDVQSISAIDSPLAVIALFVAIIELFLIFPLKHLDNDNRKRLVLFVIGYPFFIATSFFLFLWFRPANLYNPAELPEKLHGEFVNRRIIESTGRTAALELKLQEVEKTIDVLRKTQSDLSIADHTPDVKGKLERSVEKIDVDDLAKFITKELLKEGSASPNAVKAAKQVAENLIDDQRQARVEEDKQKMSKFAKWLTKLGFKKGGSEIKIKLDPEAQFIGYFYGTNEITVGEAAYDSGQSFWRLYAYHAFDASGFKTNDRALLTALSTCFADLFDGGNTRHLSIQKGGKTLSPEKLNELASNPYGGIEWEVAGAISSACIDIQAKLGNKKVRNTACTRNIGNANRCNYSNCIENHS